MKSNKPILTLGAIILALAGTTAHAADAYGGAWPTPGPQDASVHDSGGYTSYIADDDVPQATFSRGFSGYVDDAVPEAFGKGAKSCGSGDCGGCFTFDGCGGYRTPSRLWASVDYMMTWTKGRWLPPLVTTSTPADGGILGGDTTSILFGNEHVGQDYRSGGRFSLGLWLDTQETVALGARYFTTETDQTAFAAASNGVGSPLLARPFFNVDPLVFDQDALILTSPGIRRGDITALASNDLRNLDTYVRLAMYECGDRRLDLLSGYQYARIKDRLAISHRMQQIAGAFPAGTQFAFQDVFDATNTFNGATVGLMGEYGTGPLRLTMMSKLGFGNMRQVVRIDGQSTVTDPDAGQANFEGGLLALGSNLGTHTNNRFAIVPETEIKLLYQLTRDLDVSVGYSLVYWTNVAMAANQIDTTLQNTPTVNASQLLGGTLVGPDHPRLPQIDDGGFWAQGITFGVTFRR